MALGRGPGLEERCVFTYHALPIGSVSPAVDERFVTALFDLGLRRLGLVGAELKFSHTGGTPLVTEVFVDRLEATYGAIFFDSSVGAETFCFTTVLEDGLTIATLSEMPGWWWRRYGVGMKLGRDELYEEEYSSAGGLSELKARHTERVIATCAGRGTQVRSPGSMALYLALRGARARARAAWYAGQLRAGLAVALVGVGGLGVAVEVAVLLAARHAGIARAPSLLLAVALALLTCVLLGLSPATRYLMQTVGPQVHSALRRGRQTRHTDLAASELEQSVRASGASA